MPTTTESTYHLDELCIEIRQQLTSAQYLRINELLELTPGRHKVWSTHYVFDVEAPETLEPALEWLRSQAIAHGYTVGQTYDG